MTHLCSRQRHLSELLPRLLQRGWMWTKGYFSSMWIENTCGQSQAPGKWLEAVCAGWSSEITHCWITAYAYDVQLVHMMIWRWNELKCTNRRRSSLTPRLLHLPSDMQRVSQAASSTPQIWWRIKTDNPRHSKFTYICKWPAGQNSHSKYGASVSQIAVSGSLLHKLPYKAHYCTMFIFLQNVW